MADIVKIGTARLVDDIRACLNETGSIGFGGLVNLQGFVGQHALLLGSPTDNIAVWAGISPAAALAIELLRDQGECHLEVALRRCLLLLPWQEPLLCLPVTGRQARYNRLRWLPVMIRSGPAPCLLRRGQRIVHDPLVSAPLPDGARILLLAA